MKITYLHQYFLTPEMSGGTRSYEFAKRLVGRGHEVHVISALSSTGARDTEEKVDGITVHWLSVPYSNKMGFTSRIFSFLKFAILASLKARKLGGDVIFATSTPLTIALPGIFASRSLQVPMIFEVRDLWPEMPIAIKALNNSLLIKLARWLERTAYSHSNHIIALSPGMADGVINSGYPASRVSIIPNACDIEMLRYDEKKRNGFFRKHSYLINQPLVVYAGTLGKLNNVGYLAEIARESLNSGSGINFLVVGDGAEQQSIEAKAKDLQVLAKNFWMLPPVRKDEIAGILSAASLAVSLFTDLPEMWNNSANKFFDAIASGTPVAINYRGWQADILSETNAGIIIPAADPKGAASAISAFLSDSGRLTAAAAHALHLASTRFNRDSLAEQFIRVIEAEENNLPIKFGFE